MGLLNQKKINVLLLTAAYLFVVLTHILLLPNHHLVNSKSKAHFNSIFKRKLENASGQAITLMDRTYKSVLNKDQKIQSLFVKLAGYFLIWFLVTSKGWQMRMPFLIRRYFSPFSAFRLSLRI